MRTSDEGLQRAAGVLSKLTQDNNRRPFGLLSITARWSCQFLVKASSPASTTATGKRG